MLYPLPVDLIKLNEDKLKTIDSRVKDIYRLITFSRDHHADDLLDRFLTSNNSLAQLLSIKNAQMEAESEEDIQEYLENLNLAISFIVDEIKDGRNFERMTQLFELFRIISPHTHARHPNKFRQGLVQIGRTICPEPHEIPGLVAQTFDSIFLIHHPVVRAIYFHHEMIRIHPFADGNGRTIRIAKNWMLMYDLYPPIFVKDDIEKKQYINTLEESFGQLESHPGAWNAATEKFFDQELHRIEHNSEIVLQDLQRVASNEKMDKPI